MADLLDGFYQNYARLAVWGMVACAKVLCRFLFITFYGQKSRDQLDGELFPAQ